MKPFLGTNRRRKHWRNPAYGGNAREKNGNENDHLTTEVNGQNLESIILAVDGAHIQKLHWPELRLKGKNNKSVKSRSRSWKSLRIMKKVTDTGIKVTFCRKPRLRIKQIIQKNLT